jgi:hypothetical protein
LHPFIAETAFAANWDSWVVYSARQRFCQALKSYSSWKKLVNNTGGGRALPLVRLQNARLKFVRLQFAQLKFVRLQFVWLKFVRLQFVRLSFVLLHIVRLQFDFSFSDVSLPNFGSDKMNQDKIWKVFRL